MPWVNQSTEFNEEGHAEIIRAINRLAMIVSAGGNDSDNSMVQNAGQDKGDDGILGTGGAVASELIIPNPFNTSDRINAGVVTDWQDPKLGYRGGDTADTAGDWGAVGGMSNAAVYDEGVLQGGAIGFNFIGTGVAVTSVTSGGIAYISITGNAASTGYLTGIASGTYLTGISVQDETGAAFNALSFNFIGSGISATQSGTKVLVSVTGITTLTGVLAIANNLSELSGAATAAKNGFFSRMYSLTSKTLEVTGTAIHSFNSASTMFAALIIGGGGGGQGGSTGTAMTGTLYAGAGGGAGASAIIAGRITVTGYSYTTGDPGSGGAAGNNGTAGSLSSFGPYSVGGGGGGVSSGGIGGSIDGNTDNVSFSGATFISARGGNGGISAIRLISVSTGGLVTNVSTQSARGGMPIFHQSNAGAGGAGGAAGSAGQDGLQGIVTVWEA